MTQNELNNRENAHQHLIRGLGKISDDLHASDHFAAKVLAAADNLEPTHAGWLTRWFGITDPHQMSGVRIAVAAILVLAIVGAVPQYATWIDAYLLGVPSKVIYEAKTQETLWQKNFACATKLDRTSENYAAISVENVVVVTWACPSGDVLVTLESPTDDASRRSVWIPMQAATQTTSIFDLLIPKAYAARGFLRMAKRGVPMVTVLCQKWLPRKLILRRVKLADERCVDEVINPRTGRTVKRKKVSCERKC